MNLKIKFQLFIASYINSSLDNNFRLKGFFTWTGQINLELDVYELTLLFCVPYIHSKFSWNLLVNRLQQ